MKTCGIVSCDSIANADPEATLFQPTGHYLFAPRTPWNPPELLNSYSLGFSFARIVA